MAINTDILNFLRDANYKIGEIGIWLRENKHSASADIVRSQIMLRRELIGFMEVVYEGQYSLADGKTNFLDWPDSEILAEIHRLRYKAGLNDIPYFTFSDYHPVINIRTSTIVAGAGDGAGFPAGNPLDLFQINLSNEVVAAPINNIGGHAPSETIEQIFP